MLKIVFPILTVAMFLSSCDTEKAKEYASWKNEIDFSKTCIHKYCKVKTKYGEYCYSQEMAHQFPCKVIFGPGSEMEKMQDKMQHLFKMFDDKKSSKNKEEGD